MIDRIQAIVREPESFESRARIDAAPFFYTINLCDDLGWSELLDGFKDANIFQTIPFGSTKAPRSHLERFVVSKGSEVVAVALVRVTTLPVTGAGCAYVRWGPLWQRKGSDPDHRIWQEAIAALRAEYATKRKMWLRLLPSLTTQEECDSLISLLLKQGFCRVKEVARQRTMVIDLRPSLETLRAGMESRARRHLNAAERNNLQITEGFEEHLFDQFALPFREMIARKRFSNPGDLDGFRKIHLMLPARHQTKVFIASLGDEICAGAIVSAIGNRGVYHFGATASKGMNTKASYLLQWRIISWLKEKGCTEYDLHGVNLKTNPGVYAFKAGLTGRNGAEVEFAGAFDAYGSRVSRFVAAIANRFRRSYR